MYSLKTWTIRFLSLDNFSIWTDSSTLWWNRIQDFYFIVVTIIIIGRSVPKTRNLTLFPFSADFRRRNTIFYAYVTQSYAYGHCDPFSGRKDIEI